MVYCSLSAHHSTYSGFVFSAVTLFQSPWIIVLCPGNIPPSVVLCLSTHSFPTTVVYFSLSANHSICRDFVLSVLNAFQPPRFILLCPHIIQTSVVCVLSSHYIGTTVDYISLCANRTTYCGFVVSVLTPPQPPLFLVLCSHTIPSTVVLCSHP